MLNNYFKIALRNLGKQKLHSFINIFGLALGIACCLMIYLFVHHEWSYDEFHEKADRIYRVEDVNYTSVEAARAETFIWDTRSPEGVEKSAFLPLPLGPVLKERYPDIERVVRYDESTALVRNGKTVFEEPVSYVEDSFFEVFSFDLLAGNAATVLQEKEQVVITPKIADKYFGDVNPVGKVLQIKIRDQEMPFVVSGIAESPPDNSSIQYQLLLPIENKPFYERHIDNWKSFNTALFLELSPEAESGQLKDKLNQFYAERYEDAMARARQRNNMPEEATVMEFSLTPLTAIHLDASIPWYNVSNPLYSYILSGIAILILLIACINYITLALTRSSRRAREVGIRKAVGADRRQIAWQFFGETQLMALVGMVAGIGLSELFLPVFNELAGHSLEINYLQNAGILGVLIGVTGVTGIIAGSYPALLLSRFNPVEVLKSNTTYKIKPRFTRILLVSQYALSVFLIVSSLIMYRQLDYISQKDLGYDEEQVVVLPTHTGWSEEGTQLMKRYRQELRTMNDVVNVSGMAPAFTMGSNIYGFRIEGEIKDAFVYYVDERFIETLGMKLAAGRDFSGERPVDKTESIIVNQALVEMMGWKNPIGEELPWKGQNDPSTVIGVVEDFHFQSLEAPIKPMLLHMDPRHGGVSSILVRIQSGQIAEALPKMESVWADVAPFTPFDYWFLDDAVAEQYQNYRHWMDIMAYSTAFAILIACLGLFGLAGIMAVNKTKEIGIRKVFGAGIEQLLMLLNKDIVKLVSLSILLATPLSWFVMDRWLGDFAYRIDIGAKLFVIAGAASLGIALLAVSYHTVKTALINPVDSLRNE